MKMTSEREEAINAMKLKLTPHAAMRFAQRGFRDGDAELIMAIGTEVEGGYLMREKDVREAEAWLKRQAHKLRRLVGKRVIVAGDMIVTAYHA